jgi:predicted Zn-dependent protease with MMP-like domain
MSEVRADPFATWVREALDSLPPELVKRVENLSIEIEDEDPNHPERLGLYRGIPLDRRSRGYVFVLPDRITIYRGPLERLYGSDPERLRRQVRRVVLHEVAHHFGISDARLREIGAY